MAEIDPLSLMIVGIIISLIGIGFLWLHPMKWKAIGTACAIVGVIINVVNVYIHANVSIPTMS